MSRLALDVEHFRGRILQDALTQATAEHWKRRAETLEEARHRPGIDWPGRATVDELRARWVALTTAAAACRQHAEVIAAGADGGEISPEVWAVLGEVA